jgi:hypothetical protein
VTLMLASPTSKSVTPGVGRQNPRVAANLLESDVAALVTVLFCGCDDEAGRRVVLSKLMEGVVRAMAGELAKARKDRPVRLVQGSLPADVLRTELRDYAQRVDARVDNAVMHLGVRAGEDFPAHVLELDAFRTDLEATAPNIYGILKLMATQREYRRHRGPSREAYANHRIALAALHLVCFCVEHFGAPLAWTCSYASPSTL